MENPHFMGDGSLFRILSGLASARHPLIQTVDNSPLDLRLRPATALTISEAGLRVLEGNDDHIRFNGIDRWIGGVQLKGVEAAWRWDQLTGRLTPTN